MHISKCFNNFEVIQFLGFFIAMTIAYLIIPQIRARALKLGVLDKPSKRRIHEKPTPRLGGIGIYISFFLTLFGIYFFSFKYDLNQLGNFPLFGILIGGTMIFILGLFDDLEPVGPINKLLIQLLAASAAWYFGVRIEHIVNPFYHGDFYFIKLSFGESVIYFSQIASYLITVFWIIVITNAINLLDGMDGLSAGVSLISAIAIWSVSIGKRIDEPVGALMSAILSGSLLGFLRWNFNPARIFLGDSGAYLTGFVLASLAISCVMKSLTLAIMTPMLILIFALPILDVIFAVIRRLVGKRSILEPDTGHLHHKVLAIGLSQKNAAYVFYFISFLFGICATYLMSIQTFLRFLILMSFVIFIMLFFTYVINWKHQKVFKTVKRKI